jgi:hypothetical protein
MRPTYRRHLGPKFSEGSRLLWAVIESQGSQEAVRRTLRTTRGVVSKWLYGDRGGDDMELKFAVRVEDAFGIPVRAWLTKPTKRFKVPVT